MADDLTPPAESAPLETEPVVAPPATKAAKKPARAKAPAPAPAAAGLLEETPGEEAMPPREWYILKVQVNREDTIRDAIERRVRVAGLTDYFDEIVVPVEEVIEFTKTGKKRTVRKKLYPGYLLIRMSVNDDTWLLVRDTPGVGDFTGAAGKPTPMRPEEVDRIIKKPKAAGEKGPAVAIPFRVGETVRVKEGYFQNFEGPIHSLDEANGRVTVMITIFGRSTPVELEHWQVESV